MLSYDKMNEKTLKSLEFQKILEALSKNASSVSGKNLILKIRPLTSLIDVQLSLDEVEEAFIIAKKCGTGVPLSFDDISDVLFRASVQSTLTNIDLIKISRFQKNSKKIKELINNIKDEKVIIIRNKAKKITISDSIVVEIDNAILSDTEISDNASNKLKDIRRKIKITGEQIRKKLDNYITSSEYSKIIQDSIITIRNDRFVVPVKAEFKGLMPGLIHDQSSSGQTLYVEPMAIVELNNEIKSLILEEKIEIERILKDLTLKVSILTPNIKDNFEILTDLDVIFAKSYYAYSTKAVKPTINEFGIINLVQARHPLIDNNIVIPTTVSLGDTYKILLVTGPNTGGKTVVLKLVGLLEIMALSGLYVPAISAKISMYDDIFCDIGDEQSIEQSLSTFSSHIKNIKFITDTITSNSLILLDELGAGTDPTEGASLAVAILKFIIEKNSCAIITTHYNELKEFAIISDEIENASMDFDPISFMPTYKLIIGTPGRSNAIEIAKNMGLNSSIIDTARDGLDRDEKHIEQLIRSLEESRRTARNNEDKIQLMLKEIENKNVLSSLELERLQKRRQQLTENAELETNKLLNKSVNEAEIIIQQMKELIKEADNQSLLLAHKLKKEIINLNASKPEINTIDYQIDTNTNLSIGMSVNVNPLNVVGTIVNINEKSETAEVLIGNIKSIIKKENLIPIILPKVEKIQPIKTNKNLINNSFSPEINLIGKSVMDASYELDIYLNKAILSSIDKIKIIHGMGTGKLKEGLRAFLKSSTFVKSFREGDYFEGGMGVTIVTLKK